MLISCQLVHRVQCVPAGLGAAGSYIPAYIFLTHFMVFCRNCQCLWSRGFICQRPCSSVWCEEKIHALVNILISHSRSTFLSLVMPKRLKANVRKCGGFFSNLYRRMPNSGKGESKACSCGLANAESDGLQMSTKPYT